MNKPPELTQWAALRQLGWVQTVDFVVAFGLACSWVTGGFWWIFGNPSLLGLGLLAAVNIMVTQVWVVVLLFRCSFFVLQMRAEINTLPAAAARLALKFQAQAPAA